jgi:hypothetical protein
MGSIQGEKQVRPAHTDSQPEACQVKPDIKRPILRHPVRLKRARENIEGEREEKERRQYPPI